MAFCSNCGAQLQGDAKFCGNCGKAAAAAQLAATVEPVETSPAAAEPVAVAQPPATSIAAAESAPAAQAAQAVPASVAQPAAAVEPAAATSPATEEPAPAAEQAETTADSAEQAGLENEGGILRNWWARNKNIIAVAAVFLAIVLFMIIFGLVSGGGATAQYTTNSGSASAQTTQTQARQTKTPADFGAFGYYEKSDFIETNTNYITVWLYNTYREYNGDAKPLYKAFERYVNSLGYYVNSYTIFRSESLPKVEFLYGKNNSNISKTVELMNRYDADVAMALAGHNLFIVNYDKDTRLYWREQWPIIQYKIK
ncbi:MAG: hypothetical protein Pg6A_02020 [Termitinemataceae bacterium]|nr:MAG: hypothetical protein Pg6A_02020 [Termitinemataceae bacterium]